MTRSPLRTPEFVALMAVLFAMIAFSVDSMLPALPEIADALTPKEPNQAQLIITIFVLGMGIGTMFSGPLSDAYGRRPIILIGGAIYALGSALALYGESLEALLAARFLQGLGVAGPRATAMAIIRDQYQGRQMARIVSFVMVVFTLVPAMAPLAGSFLIDAFGWRSLFVAFLIFAATVLTWFFIRQPETLATEDRRSLRPSELWNGLIIVVSARQVRLAMMVMSLVFGMLFALLSSIHSIFEQTFDLADEFPWWFFAMALLSGTASLLNAAIVGRLGMRRVVFLTLAMQTVFAGLMAVVTMALPDGTAFKFWITYAWMVSIFFGIGLTLGNLNSIAMEPMGKLAGMTASVSSSLSTVAAVMIAIPIGLAFNGTPMPLVIGVFICALAGAYVTLMIEDTEALPTPQET